MDDANDVTILFHSVDHLPAEMPKEASNHFGSQLIPFIKAVACSNPELPYEEMKDIPNEIRNAIVVCHGHLCPNYLYIDQMRRVRKQAKKHQEEYMMHVKEAQKKTSSLRRGYRFATVVFNGHLFDTKFFNFLIDVLEENNIDFRVIEWEVGNSASAGSQVTLQLFAKTAEDMDKAKDKIEHEAEKKKVEIFEGTGPAFE